MRGKKYTEIEFIFSAHERIWSRSEFLYTLAKSQTSRFVKLDLRVYLSIFQLSQYTLDNLKKTNILVVRCLFYCAMSIQQSALGKQQDRREPLCWCREMPCVEKWDDEESIHPIIIVREGVNGIRRDTYLHPFGSGTMMRIIKRKEQMIQAGAANKISAHGSHPGNESAIWEQILEYIRVLEC